MQSSKEKLAAIKGIIDRLKAPEAKAVQRYAAVDELAATREPAVISFLEKLARPEASLERNPKLKDILRKAIDDRDLRYKAVNAIGSIGGEHAVRPLISLLNDHDSHIAELAVKKLRSVGEKLKRETGEGKPLKEEHAKALLAAHHLFDFGTQPREVFDIIEEAKARPERK